MQNRTGHKSRYDPVFLNRSKPFRRRHPPGLVSRRRFLMKLERLREILARAAGKRIAVAGDLMLDEFVWGKVGRISPEAPVPVVEVTGETFYPGGAANVARNLREFIGGVSVIGTVGTDRRRPAIARSLARAKNRNRSGARGPRFPDDRENPDHRAAPAGRAGRSRRDPRAYREAGRAGRAESARRFCRSSTPSFLRITAKVFLSPELVRQISADLERRRENRRPRIQIRTTRSIGARSRR